jgi:hypothetical protein
MTERYNAEYQKSDTPAMASPQDPDKKGSGMLASQEKKGSKEPIHIEGTSLFRRRKSGVNRSPKDLHLNGSKEGVEKPSVNAQLTLHSAALPPEEEHKLPPGRAAHIQVPNRIENNSRAISHQETAQSNFTNDRTLHDSMDIRSHIMEQSQEG